MKRSKKPLSLVIIGSGWRAMFYARIAAHNPQRFRLQYMLCRSREKAKRLQEELGIPTTVSIEECEKAGPDFVVVAVNKSSIFQVTKEWALKGWPVLCETPAGMNIEELEQLWRLKCHGAKIQVAEQYIRYPVIAAGLQALRQGKIGDPYAVRLSVAHDYHGASLIRHMLGIEPEPVKIQGKRYVFPVTETDSRYGAVTDASVKLRERTCLTMEFASGKTAYYDFSGVQYHSFIRSRHLNVQGKDGEWNDTMLRFVGDDHLPKQEKLRLYLDPAYKELETEEIRNLAGIWNPVLELDSVQDEYAVASIMADMREYLDGGKEVYPLKEALEDACLWLLMEKAVENPDMKIESEPMIWTRQI